MIKLPKFEDRKIITGELKNNVKYSIINDPLLITTSYVYVCVGVGSNSNPPEYQGLAHFLEHMLFMGSELYPQENYWMEQINENMGSTNAYTTCNETIYHFDILNNKLADMINIFSRFFIDPLFLKDSVSREVNAVDNEHVKNSKNDGWASNYFIRTLADKTINTFGTGSLKTLDKPGLRDALIEFFNEYYTSDNISVCIGSLINSEKILEYINKSFGNIENKQHKVFLEKPFYHSNIGKTFILNSFETIYNIKFIWEVPKLVELNLHKPHIIFSSLITQNGENSLKYHLKNCGFSSSISVDNQDEGVIILDIDLTVLGHRYVNKIKNIIDNWLYQILKFDLKKYAEYQSKILNINFNYGAKEPVENLCNMFAINHLNYPSKDIYINNFQIDYNFDYNNWIKKYINKAIILIQSPKNKPENKLEHYDLKWQQVDYKHMLVKRLPEYLIDFENKYFNISVKKNYNNSDLVETPKKFNNHYYGSITKFNEPICIIWIGFYSDKFYANPKNSLLSKLSVDILNFIISNKFVKAIETFGTVIFTSNTSLNSIQLNISGLNSLDFFNEIVTDIIEIIREIDISDLNIQYIKNLISDYKNDYENIDKLTPWEYIDHLDTWNTLKTSYNNITMIEACKNITLKDVKTYILNLFDDCNIQTFSYGFMKNEELIKINKLFDVFSSNNKNVIPKHILSKSFNEKLKDANSKCVKLLFKWCNKLEFENIAYGIVLKNILAELFFDEMRTKKQMGYLVRFSFVSNNSYYYMMEKIQTNKELDFVKKSLVEFNQNIEKNIRKAKCKEIIKNIQTKLLEKSTSIFEEFSKYFSQIANKEYVYDFNEIIAEELDNFDINVLLKMVKNTFDNQIIQIIS